MTGRISETKDSIGSNSRPGVDQALPVHQFYTYRLHKLTALLSRQMHEQLQARYNLNLAEWRTIGVLGDRGSMSVRDVARSGTMDKAQVSRLLPNLIERGIVERSGHATDRRRASLMLTDKGQALFVEIHKLGTERQAWLSATLGADKMAIFDDCLDRLLSRVEAEPQGPFSQVDAA